MLVIFWPRSGTHELYRYAGITGNRFGLVETVYDVAAVAEIRELHSLWIIDQREHPNALRSYRLALILCRFHEQALSSPPRTKTC